LQYCSTAVTQYRLSADLEKITMALSEEEIIYLRLFKAYIRILIERGIYDDVINLMSNRERAVVGQALLIREDD
jgi:hypothetical protein